MLWRFLPAHWWKSWGPLATTSFISIVLLVVPAFLVGCSLPLFAAYLGTLRPRGVFSIAYGVYNLGAALTALALFSTYQTDAGVVMSLSSSE